MTDIEKQLGELKPVALSVDLLDRFDHLMVGEISTADHVVDEPQAEDFSERGLEILDQSLRDLVPYGMPADMISRLDDAMSRWHETVPVEEKIVELHPQEKQSDEMKGESKPAGSWFGFRAAAAVAVLGAGLAFLPGFHRGTPTFAQTKRNHVLTHGQISPHNIHRASSVAFSAKDARAQLISANDRGVIWIKDGPALRCLEVRVNNQLQFEGKNGEKLIFEQPVSEVRFIPEKVD